MVSLIPPACGKVEKILCVSEKIFKKIQKDFESFGQTRKVQFLGITFWE